MLPRTRVRFLSWIFLRIFSCTGRGVGGCKTPLSTLLSKEFGKIVAGELAAAAVRPEARVFDTHRAEFGPRRRIPYSRHLRLGPPCEGSQVECTECDRR
jgi:hypothetical protein